LRDPVELVERMWNHALQMRGEVGSRKVPFPKLDGQELTDLLVYLQNLPELRSAAFEFRLPAGQDGSELLDAKGCTKCHIGEEALTGERIGKRTLTDIASAMWNHAPEMRGKAATLTSNEIREILGLLWTRAFFSGGGGNAGRGGKMFAANCAGCHEAQKIARGQRTSAMTMVSALWMHGPKMLAEIERREKVWPKLSPRAVADVIAFWNAGRF
jgi:hypothetical protein